MKEELIRQSIQLFDEKGFTNTSIQQITDALHVTKGTFYYYFASKEQLLYTIHLHYVDELLKRQQTIMNQKQTALEKLSRIITLIIEDMDDVQLEARVFFREMKHLSTENNQNIKQKRKQFRLNVQSVIEQGQDHREISNTVKADLAAFAVLGMTNYCYEWYKQEGTLSTSELAVQYVEMILKGMVANERNDEGS
ncbi:TetR/AcrR family transcriptional regulator [Kurthia senegalensis]|uniref:TetR/AcrR family transcriptional regulator n=1 Tax=Kurthia senegalensis TaxID=1033740 RepID=UPI000288F001|nr:TetR/AcrR family transcriptional regulator [Kurthia senegalensis]